MFYDASFITEGAHKYKLWVQGLMPVVFCRGDKFANIACVNKDAKKWDFIVDIEFLSEVKNGVSLKRLLYYVDFISAISGMEYVVCIP